LPPFRNANLEVVDLLLASGADINVARTGGRRFNVLDETDAAFLPASSSAAPR